MRYLFFLIALLAAGPALGQSRPGPGRPVRKAVAPLVSRVLPALRAGDTVYVASTALHLRSTPGTDYQAHLAFEHNDKLVVQEVTGADWVLIEHWSEDVGVRGYVRRQYLSATRLPPLPRQMPWLLVPGTP